MNKLTLIGICAIGAVMLSLMIAQQGFGVELPKVAKTVGIVIASCGLVLTVVGLIKHKKNFRDSKDYQHQVLGG